MYKNMGKVIRFVEEYSVLTVATLVMVEHTCLSFQTGFPLAV